MTDPREAKLPMWVRHELATLRRRVENAERERSEARLDTDPYESDAILDAYADIPIGLGMGTQVRFRLGGKDRRDWADIKVMHDRFGDPYLQIMTSAGLSIEPRNSNVVHLQVNS